MISRYFSVAFPLHVADEEKSILPRLRGRSPSLDAALVRMHEQHDVHESMIERFCTLTAAVRIDPRDPGARSALASIARPLASVLRDHLDSEEQIVFPVIRATFSAQEQKMVRREIEARRNGTTEDT
jgi:hemerythrin-like domain-containing protein